MRTSEEVPGKGDSVVAIKIILGTPDQSKLIRDPLRRHAVFSFQESSANTGFFDLTIASRATPSTLGNTTMPIVP